MFYTRHLLRLTPQQTAFTPKQIFHQTPFTPHTIYTTRPLHQQTFTPGNFYTRSFSHQTTFTPGTLYTKHLLHQKPLKPSNIYNKQLLHQEPFLDGEWLWEDKGTLFLCFSWWFLLKHWTRTQCITSDMKVKLKSIFPHYPWEETKNGAKICWIPACLL